MKNFNKETPRFRTRISTSYWKLFNFAVRRVVAILFVVGGLFGALTGIPVLFLGGSVPVNGVPNDDFVLRIASVLLPLLVALIGVALYRVPPYDPSMRFGSGKHDA
jgi:hypothetical protein